MTQIIPAILTDSKEILESQIHQIENFTDTVHLDIGDGIFVPRKTVKAEDIKATKIKTYLSPHLMVQDPLREVERWRDTPNIKDITFHLETAENALDVIQQIKANGWRAGIAINPETLPEEIGQSLSQADFVLFMSVYPGKQGQSFIPKVLEKIKIFKQKYPYTPIGIDGGIHQNELEQLLPLGLEFVIMGSEIFNHPNPGERLKELQKLC